MVERVGLYTDPLLEVEGDPYAGTVNPYTGVNPAAQSGLDALRSGLVDQAVALDQPVERSRFEMAGGLSTPPSEFGMAELEAFQRSTTPLEFAQSFQAPQQAQPTQGIRLGFDPDQGKYLINNTVVDTRDIQGLQRVPELIQEPLSPELPAGNWRPIDIETLKRNKDELLDISIGERIGLGTREVIGSIPSGFGRMAEAVGAERLGGALVGFGQDIMPDEFDQARQAAVAEAENVFQNFVTGVVPQAAPSVGVSIGSGIAGGLAGGALIGGPVGATIGAIIGGASTIFPMMFNSAYDTALRQQGEDFVKSDRGKAEILATALATTGVQILPGTQVSGKVVPVLMQRAATQVANKATSGVAGTAAKVGFTEGMAEMTALVIEQVAFDPETRAMMSEGEVAAMVPYVADVYGREAATAFAAGAVLGGGVGAVTGAITRQAEGTSAEPSEGDNLLVPTDEAPSGPEFTGRMRGVGPQGVLPMEGLGGQIERARRSRQVGYQPPKEGEQSNLLERPAPVADEAQLDLGFAEEVEITEPVRPTAIEEQLRPQLRQREFEQAQAQRRAREEAAAEAQRQQQIADEARVPPVDLRRGPRVPGEAVPQQAPLFTRRQARALSRGEQLRRGIQQPPTTVPDIDQIAPVVRPPAQQELFTRRGLPTAAARVSPEVAVEPGAVFGTVAGAPFRSEVSALGQRQRVSRDTGIPASELEVVETDEGFFLTRAGEEVVAPEVAVPTVVEPPPIQEELALPEGVPDAIQEPSPAAVPAREPAGVSEEVGARVPSVAEPARAREQEVVQETQEVARQQDVREDVEVAQLTDPEFVNSLIETVENTRSSSKYQDAISYLLDWGYNADANQKRAGLDRLIFDYLNGLPIDAATQAAVVEFARLQSAPILAADRNGNLTPTFEYILKTQQFDAIRSLKGFRNLPEGMQPEPEVIAVDVETSQQVPTDLPEATAEQLSRMIRDYNSRTTPMNAADRRAAVDKLAEQYAVVVEQGLQDFTDAQGVPVSNYFREDGQPIAVVRDNILRITTDETAEARTITAFSEWNATEDALQSEQERIEELGLGDFAGFGRFSTLDAEPITQAMEPGRVRIAVNKFKNRLRIKPKTFVFRDQADLQTSNPELYQRAVAARPQGDFDTKVAAGYSFGSGADATVIIFSNRILTNQQLNYVMAHETLGHFGFRALVSVKQFDDFMRKLYDENGPESALAQEVDAAMAANPDLDLSIAVEEYLADYAAQLDVNLVARIFNFIKNALNRLGIEFADDSARYLINQSRRYVRNGEISSLTSVSDMMQAMQVLETGQDPQNTGRFAPAKTLRADNILAGIMQDVTPFDHEGAIKWFKDQRVNVSGSWDGFKNQFFNLLVFRARENAGLSAVHDVVSQSRDIAMSVRREMQERLSVVLDRAVLDKFSNLPAIGGATKEQVETVNKFLYEGLRYSLNSFRPEDLSDTRLYSVDQNGNVIANQQEIDSLFAMGTLSFEQMRDGFSYDITFEEAGETKTETVTVDGVPGLTEDSVEWRGYLAARETVKDVELKLLKARNLSYVQDREYAFREIAVVMENETITPASRQFLERMYNKYRELWTEDQIQDENGDLIYNPESIDTANRFLTAFNTAIIAREASATDDVAAERNAAVAEFFPETPAGNIDAAIEQFKTQLKPVSFDDRFLIQNRIKDIIVADLSDSQADLATKVTIATGYVPLMRRGGFEVRIEAFDARGNRVALRQEYKDQLAYRQFEDESEALNVSEKMNTELFGDDTYDVEVFNPDTQQIELQSVTLRASVSAVLDAPAAPPQLNLNDFVRGLRQFNIVLPPRKLQEVIVDLTAQNNRARKRLQRRLIEGFDPDALRAIAEHVESRASTVSKIIMRPRLAELTNLRLAETRRLWDGDKTLLDRLQAEWESLRDNPEATEAQKLYAKREYNRYAYMYNKTNPEGRAKQGKKYFNEASRLLQFIENNQDISESDFARGPTVSAIRASTSIMQLGGSVATGALNYLALLTNYVPYMTSYNSKTAFGGGFSFGPTMRELYTAMDQVGLRKSISDTRLNTAEFYDEIATSESMQTEFGLADHEARFIATEIREGTMIPAQMNMLTELALGRIKSAAFRRVIEGYMWTFNATERGSRRSAGLAAYRLEYNRRLDAGFSPAQSSEFARQFAVETLRSTLGEYSVTNRPAAWRSGIQSFLYIYKIFPTTSIQMLSRLPREGQIKMLGSLLILSGVSGLPFAEDLEDMIDTIAQRLGLGSASIRKEAASLADSILPGSSPIFLSGIMRAYLPGDVASRTSLGDFIPGTGVLLAGSSTTREVAEVAGPAWSMISGVGTALNTAFKAATTEQVTLEDVLRNAPITGARMLGDAAAYIDSGAVVDRRGYVVSPEMHWGVIASRLMGFYPSAAANQYDIIRISKRIADYQREVSAGFKYGWIRAKIRGDEREARAIMDAAKQWNASNRDKGMQINISNWSRSLREAKRPALERLRRSAPKAARRDMERVAELIGYEQ